MSRRRNIMIKQDTNMIDFSFPKKGTWDALKGGWENKGYTSMNDHGLKYAVNLIAGHTYSLTYSYYPSESLMSDSLGNKFYWDRITINVGRGSTIVCNVILSGATGNDRYKTYPGLITKTVSFTPPEDCNVIGFGYHWNARSGCLISAELQEAESN